MPHPLVQPEIAHHLLRAVESADVADRRHVPAATARLTPAIFTTIDRGIVHCVLRDLAVEQGRVFRQAAKLTEVPIDRCAFNY